MSETKTVSTKEIEEALTSKIKILCDAAVTIDNYVSNEIQLGNFLDKLPIKPHPKTAKNHVAIAITDLLIKEVRLEIHDIISNAIAEGFTAKDIKSIATSLLTKFANKDQSHGALLATDSLKWMIPFSAECLGDSNYGGHTYYECIEFTPELFSSSCKPIGIHDHHCDSLV